MLLVYVLHNNTNVNKGKSISWQQVVLNTTVRPLKARQKIHILNSVKEPPRVVEYSRKSSQGQWDRTESLKFPEWESKALLFTSFYLSGECETGQTF